MRLPTPATSTRPSAGIVYAGTFSAYLPFSRRFELLFNVPYLVSNGTSDPRRGYTSQFGDFFVTPRFLLAESKSTTHIFALGIRTPTGTHATFNEFMALMPRHEFWTNPGGAWVLRGANGVIAPLEPGQDQGAYDL